MKKTLLMLTITLIFGIAAEAQTARQLYLGYENNDKIAETPKPNGKIKPPAKLGKPGAKIVIERMRGDKLAFVSANSKFRSGDKIRLRFETNFEGYLAIMNVGSTGEVSLLFPYTGADASIKPSKDTRIPKGEDWIVFDDNPGTETLTVIMAKNPIGLDDNADLRELNKKATNTRDLFVESGTEATYAVCPNSALEKPIGFTLRLKHGK